MSVPQEAINVLEEHAGSDTKLLKTFMRALLLLEDAGYEVTTVTLTERQKREKLLWALMEQGASLNEIRRTTGADHRTVKRLNPNYKPFPVGGAGDAAVIRETNRKLREFEKTGKVGRNKDAGFNLRRDAL